MGNVRRLSDYLDATWPRDVPDPYYGGEAGFEYVLDMLEAACPKILAECLHRAFSEPMPPSLLGVYSGDDYQGSRTAGEIPPAYSRRFVGSVVLR